MTPTVTQEEIHTIIAGTFSTEIGKKCLEHLTKTIVDRPVYKTGMTFEEVAFREGQRDIITQIIKEIQKG